MVMSIGQLTFFVLIMYFFCTGLGVVVVVGLGVVVVVGSGVVEGVVSGVLVFFSSHSSKLSFTHFVSSCNLFFLFSSSRILSLSVLLSNSSLAHFSGSLFASTSILSSPQPSGVISQRPSS